MRRLFSGSALALTTVLVCSAAFADAESPTELTRRLLQEAVAEPSNSAKVESLLKVLVETPAGSGRYVVEGDISIAREEIVDYLKSLKNPDIASSRSDELIVNLVGGKFDYWKNPEQRKLTFGFDEKSFPTADNVQFTRAKFRAAADDWIAACPECGITFTEVAENPFFKIKYEPTSDGTIAMSFFPSSPPSDRFLYVYKPFLAQDLQFDPVGVLRHEIGHILGYRHEHIANIPGCATEGTSWKPITPYTANSVMHYFCGGKGSLDLALRDADKRGHRCLYQTGKACPVSN
ncbi:hypothetical protein [Bradyrhizobium iriomotense]|uniref:Peptidase metallopeptidase domain-containing protein n=1 Tax=Bradyrhizobium iriomotense TaxID=441950 RepID=A0ABQ6BDZ3_9BRAD|nr:hypothetical protein [Bradyrhizobium iriomotense]GLR90377.1 hypothetical protein GCM10007857_70920 [Bradyrhizobium iriomotense]